MTEVQAWSPRGQAQRFFFCLDGLSARATSVDKNEGRAELEKLPQWHNLFICGVGVGGKSSGEKTDGRGQCGEAKN